MDNKSTYELNEFIGIIKKRKKTIIFTILISVLISGIVSFFIMKPTYECKTTVIIGNTGNSENDNLNYSYNDVIMYQTLLKTYNAIAYSDIVAKQTINKMDNKFTVDDIHKFIKVTPETDTQLIIFEAYYYDKEETYKLINSFTSTFISEAKNVFPLNSIQILDKAETPQNPEKSKKYLIVFTGFILGILFSIALCYVIESFDKKIGSEEEFENKLGINVMGKIPNHNKL